MSFADAETRAAASVMGRLANASAKFASGAGAGVDIPVIFDNGAQSVLNGLADAAQPTLQLLDSDLGARTLGDRVDVTYKGAVTSHALRNPLPDGAGMTIVALELAP